MASLMAMLTYDTRPLLQVAATISLDGSQSSCHYSFIFLHHYTMSITTKRSIAAEDGTLVDWAQLDRPGFG